MRRIGVILCTPATDSPTLAASLPHSTLYMAAFTTSYAWFAIRGTTITPIVFTSPPCNIAIAASTPFITILPFSRNIIHAPETNFG